MEGGRQHEESSTPVEPEAEVERNEAEPMSDHADAVQYVIDRDLRLVSTVSDPDATRSTEGAVKRRYEDRVAQIQHDTRRSGV